MKDPEFRKRFLSGEAFVLTLVLDIKWFKDIYKGEYWWKAPKVMNNKIAKKKGKNLL